ncbi:MAG: hypothetical protein AAF467_23435 [Actinomycetota bacterium]
MTVDVISRVGAAALAIVLVGGACSADAGGDGSALRSEALAPDELPRVEAPGDTGGNAPGDGEAGDGAARPAVLVGAAVPGSDPEALAGLEADIAATVGVVRVFTRWNTPFPTADHQRLLDEGRTLHLSVRPRTDDGTVIAWRALADAEPGSDVYERLVEWVDAVAPLGEQVYFTMNHEPETSDSAANGDAADFVAAWRRTVEVLRERGGTDTRTVLVLGRSAYASGEIDEWYPGDDVVDVIGVDPYNWYDCQGTDRPWLMPDELLAPALAFAAEHGKPLAVPEIASSEDWANPQRKADWIDALADTLATPLVAEQVEFVAWFSVIDRSWPGCAWPYDSSTESADAFARLISRFEPAG